MDTSEGVVSSIVDDDSSVHRVFPRPAKPLHLLTRLHWTLRTAAMSEPTLSPHFPSSALNSRSSGIKTGRATLVPALSSSVARGRRFAVSIQRRKQSLRD